MLSLFFGTLVVKKEGGEHMPNEDELYHDDEDDDMPQFFSPQFERYVRQNHEKYKTQIDRFLGKARRTGKTCILPNYYNGLLAWSFCHYLEKNDGEIMAAFGYHYDKPIYKAVKIDCQKCETLPLDAQLLVRYGQLHLLVTIDLIQRNSILIEGRLVDKAEIDKFGNSILTLAKEDNFYRHKEIEFAGEISFLDLEGRNWDSVIIDHDTKDDIQKNTTGFLGKLDLWPKLGIPPKRGILLSGEPGTGKTIICKAVMAESENITCITTSAYSMFRADYITELYDLAKDLAPCIVFIEDLDLVGQNREEYGYSSGPVLLSLLAKLDGIEKSSPIVTIATTNCLDILDKALSKRPARFDRVIELKLPNLEQRRKIIIRLCERIPLNESDIEYIARNSDGYTPAQVQEIVFSLALEKIEDTGYPSPLDITRIDIDRIMARVKVTKEKLGFSLGNNGHKVTRLT
jgi:cell division protease FtsH